MTDYLRPYQARFIEQVALALDEVHLTGHSRGIVLIGESGVGKTYLFDKLAQIYAPRSEGSRHIVPSFRLSVGSKANADSHVRTILAQLRRPAWNLKGDRLWDTLRQAVLGTEAYVGLLEEFHNGILKATPAVSKQNSEFLKDVWNLHDPNNPRTWASPLTGEKPRGVLLVISGTPALEAPLFSDSELGSRFNIVIRAERPSLFPESAQQDFQSLVKALRDRFGLPKDISPNDAELLARLFFATSAHLRLLQALFVRTASLLRRKTSLTTRGALAEAYAQVIPPSPDGEPNPFKLSAAELAERVNRERIRAARTRP
jgi:energy-coupling factor transporter ATP-binding protein EcfA2